jgi:hypothetical protein
MIRCTFDGSFEFNRIHGFGGLKSIDPDNIYEDKGQLLKGTKHWLFIDMPETIERRKEEVKAARQKGIKIISLFYDEARFPLVDRLISEGVIDKLILFDKQYRDRFDIDVFVSDYYVEDSAFPEFHDDRNGKMCYFGHKSFDRELPDKCKHIIGANFQQLYQMASHHSRGYVASTGKGENGGIIYHNKAKFIEMLFCGLQVECQDGINTINYEEYKNKKITKESLEDLRQINHKVRVGLLSQITN